MTALAGTPPRSMGLTIAMLILVIDQVSKGVVLGSPAVSDGVEILPVLNLVLVRNEGVTFGLFGGLAPWWALTLIALGILAILSAWLWHTPSPLAGTALGLIVGGALGNILDRVRHGAVTDFLDLHAQGYHWPAFNLADVAVVCGVSILLLSQCGKA